MSDNSLRPIRRILIANRGEIALRIQRTCREMGIETVAIYSDPDRQAPFVLGADVAIYIGPPMASASFLAIDRIVEIARSAGADAVHPGYGFLAENAGFAEACAAADIRFIGPSPAAILAMGNKTRAKQVAAEADVPVVPGFSADGLSDGDIETRASHLGYPVLLKAAAGGGGKGMRIVRAAGELTAALAAARRESAAAFGDDSLLVERYIENPRHIEVQILGDLHGNLVHCFERECSIQRRYQKIIEEAPSPAVDDELRERMTGAALRLARRIGYASAGTVEFVVGADGSFYFLEVNTRLQVEHPVTEAVTGLDLVRLQIEIAEGRPLPFEQDDLSLFGHAIEARLCAEDPERDFLPATGKILAWDVPELPDLRVDTGVTTGSEISIYYDSLIAKCIAHGTDRAAAARLLAYSLDRIVVHGLRSNRAFLARLLREPEFERGAIDTHYLSRHPELTQRRPDQSETDRLHAVAVALWQQEQRRHTALLANLPSGWRNNPSQLQQVTFRTGDDSITVGYRIRSGGQATVVCGEQTYEMRIVTCGKDTIRLEAEAAQREFRISASDTSHFVQSELGVSELMEEPRFPSATSAEFEGGCQAPMPGKVLAIRVAVGDSVTKGQVLAVLEAMKMEHDVSAPYDGTVAELRVAVGQQVNTGETLVVVTAAAAD